MDEQGPGDARCGPHGASAVGVCTRCGAFICPQCRTVTEGAGGRCPACQVVPKTSILAIFGVILSALPCAFLWIIGGALSIAAFFQIKNRPDELTGRGIAIAGMVLAGIWTGVMVLGVVAAIAIPSFIRYQGKARQAEVKTELARIQQLQDAHLDAHGSYAPDIVALGYLPPAGAGYAYYFGLPQPLGATALPLPPDRGTGLDGQGYSAVAVGNIDSDEVLDVWEVREAGAPQALQDDLEYMSEYEVEPGWSLGAAPETAEAYP